MQAGVYVKLAILEEYLVDHCWMSRVITIWTTVLAYRTWADDDDDVDDPRVGAINSIHWWMARPRMNAQLLSRRSRQRERLSASELFICLSVCLSGHQFVCRQNAIKRDFLKS